MKRAILQFIVLSGLVFGVMITEPFEFATEDKELAKLRNQGETPAWAKARDYLPKEIKEDEHIASR